MGCNISTHRHVTNEELSNWSRSPLARLSLRSHRPLAGSNNYNELVYDVIIQLKHDDKDIYACCFPSDDDGVLLSASKVEQTTFLRHARDFSSIRLWDLDRRQINTGFLADFPRSCRSCDFSPDGQLVVSIFSEDSLALVRMRSWKTTSAEVIQMRRIWRTRGTLMCCAFSPEGRSIMAVSRLSGDVNHICMIDVNSRKMTKKMSPTLASKIRGFVKSCIFSPDGLFLSISSSSGQLLILDIQDLHIYESLDLENQESTSCLCEPFHQSSRRSITLSMQSWYLFDPRYGHKYLASCIEDGTIQIWTLNMNQSGLNCIQTVNVLQTPRQKICSAAFSPDGQILAIGTSDSKILCLNSESLDLLFTLNAHLQPDGLRTWYPNTEVSCLSFTRTCQQLAAGYNDGRIRVWQLPLIINLQHMCRLAIIKHIPASEISKLPLPSHLVHFLLYSPMKHN